MTLWRARYLKLLERMIPLSLTVFVPVAGGLWAVYVFTQNQADLASKQSAEREAQTRAKLVELQKPFIDQQFATYRDVTKLVSELLVWTGDRARWDAAYYEYKRLHWGAIALVEDKPVHEAKKLYVDALEDYAKGGSEERLKRIQDASEVLMTAMRSSIQSSWTTGNLGVGK
jgi:hypothetical protein